jgi:hypothetical protein
LYGFGSSVSISGNIIAVGALGVFGSHGSAHIFEKNREGKWNKVTEIAPQSSNGGSVKATVVGSKIGIGAPQDNFDAGNIWIYGGKFVGVVA